MEYLEYHGHYHDLPIDEIYESYSRHYPYMTEYSEQLKGNFEKEAIDGINEKNS